ncbi:MAG: hypothetical protein PHE49_02035 [bacterium]|nr:hypothetical protein [bacterium]
MAIYINSPFGEIRGKLGGVVGTRLRGKKIVRIYRKPKKDPGSIALLKELKKGKISAKEMNIKIVNVRFLFKFFSGMSKQKYSSIIVPVWSNIAKVYQNTPSNMIHKFNVPVLFNSIPDKNKLCDETNIFDVSKIAFTPETYTPPFSISSNYNPETGEIKVSWQVTKWFYDAKPEDKVFCIAVYFKPKSLLLWEPKKDPWNIFKIWGTALVPVAQWKDEQASLPIDPNLKPEYLTTFFFFQYSNKRYSTTYSAKQEAFA